jgi:hypothetical protein
MPLHDCRSVHLPYCLIRQPDGRYIVLNREYKPLGFYTQDWVDYEAYPIAVSFRKFTKKTAARLSWAGSKNLEQIFLYDGSCIPTVSTRFMEAYLKRLGILAKLRCDKDDLWRLDKEKLWTTKRPIPTL